MKTAITVTGFKELEQALATELPKTTAKSVLRRTAINSMKRLETRAKQLAPVDDGGLRDSITTKPTKVSRIGGSRKFAAQGGVSVSTGPTGREEGGNPAWQEFGTVKMPAHPYMRPAADSEGAAVIGDVRDELALQIDKAKQRIARKAAKGR